MNNLPLTTDEWVNVNAPGLADEIACHIKNMAEEINEEDKAILLRLIMISVRQWDEE